MAVQELPELFFTGGLSSSPVLHRKSQLPYGTDYLLTAAVVYRKEYRGLSPMRVHGEPREGLYNPTGISSPAPYGITRILASVKSPGLPGVFQYEVHKELTLRASSSFRSRIRKRRT